MAIQELTFEQTEDVAGGFFGLIGAVVSSVTSSVTSAAIKTTSSMIGGTIAGLSGYHTGLYNGLAQLVHGNIIDAALSPVTAWADTLKGAAVGFNGGVGTALSFVSYNSESRTAGFWNGLTPVTLPA